MTIAVPLARRTLNTIANKKKTIDKVHTNNLYVRLLEGQIVSSINYGTYFTLESLIPFLNYPAADNPSG